MLPFDNIQLDPEVLPSVDDIEYVGLERPYLTIALLQNFFLFGACVIFWLLSDQWKDADLRYLLYWGGLALLVLVALRFITIYLNFKWKGYALRERDLAYKKGWLFRSIILVPFKRVQHAEVSQGPLARMFGLARLKVYTAGGNQSDLSIPGLTLERAEQLKRFVLKKLDHGEEE